MEFQVQKDGGGGANLANKLCVPEQELLLF